MRDLTKPEARATEFYIDLLTIPEVVPRQIDRVRAALSTIPGPMMDAEFVLWLSEGTLTLVGNELVPTHLLDENTHPLTESKD